MLYNDFILLNTDLMTPDAQSWHVVRPSTPLGRLVKPFLLRSLPGGVVGNFMLICHPWLVLHTCCMYQNDISTISFPTSSCWCHNLPENVESTRINSNASSTGNVMIRTMGFSVFPRIFRYPLVNVYIAMERSTIFHGKIHYFDWAIFNCKLFVHQRVPNIGD